MYKVFVFCISGPPINDPDLLALLRSFPHEMSVVPSAAITSALKQDKGIPINEQFVDPSIFIPPSADGLPVSVNDMAFQQSSVSLDMPPLEMVTSPVDIGSALPEPAPGALLGQLGQAPLGQAADQMFADVPAARSFNSGNIVPEAQNFNAQPEVLYPELQNVQPLAPMVNSNNNVLQAGKPTFIDGQLVRSDSVGLNQNTPVMVDNSASKRIGKVSDQRRGQRSQRSLPANLGVPINMMLASRFG